MLRTGYYLQLLNDRKMELLKITVTTIRHALKPTKDGCRNEMENAKIKNRSITYNSRPHRCCCCCR